MARFNEILTGRFNRLLQKSLGMKGGPPAAQLASEITPQLSIPDFGLEVLVHLGWYRYGLFQNALAVVANFSWILLRNPPNSGILAVVEKATASITGPNNCELQYGQPGAVDGTVTAARSLDGRNGRASGLIASFGSTAGGRQIGTTIVTAALPTTNFAFDFIVFENHQIVLSPGDAVQIQSDVANSPLLGSLFWRERAIEESEVKT